MEDARVRAPHIHTHTHTYSWKLNRNRANLETEVGTTPPIPYTFHSRWTDRYPGKGVYIRTHLSTVSSRKLKLLYQTVARLCAADFSCNTCLSRDSRRLASRLSRETFVSRVTRDSKFSQRIDRNRDRFPFSLAPKMVENMVGIWLTRRRMETLESSIEMKIFDAFVCSAKRRSSKRLRKNGRR